MTKVDSFRFVGGITKRMAKKWIALENPTTIPWTPLPKRLVACTIAIITTGAIRLKEDEPFDQEGERQDPWWGDPSYRTIPQNTTSADIRVDHLHIKPEFAEQDINCLLPNARLTELADAGEIGRPAPTHYSLMGYQMQPEEMLVTSVPAIIRQMKDEAVDAVLLVPA